MVGRKRKAPGSAPAVPDIYQEMLDEVGVRAGARRQAQRPRTAGPAAAPTTPARATAASPPAPTIQTLERDSDDEDDEDIEFEDVDISAFAPPTSTAAESAGPVSSTLATPDSATRGLELELNLAAHQQRRASTTPKKKPITREEKEWRVTVHKAHVVCLLAHVARRNRWCNDPHVQEQMRSMLSKKTIGLLNPKDSLTQFGRTESLKAGLKEARDAFKARFKITQRGLRRALWADDEKDLDKYEPPSDMDSCFDRAEFRIAADELKGSRDVGAQLFCAMLRSAGVETRLVCSLQPLAYGTGGPTLPKPRETRTPAKPSLAEKNDQVRASMALYDAPAASAASPSARRRLGHPHAAAANFVPPPAPAVVEARSSTAVPKRIKESPFPVYWVEVLDEAHQKWQPVDPLVTNTMWRREKLEPPAADRENNMSYVVAFQEDDTARDVTPRYVKAYTAKTMRTRVETVMERGDRWWRRALRPYSRLDGWHADLDQIEDIELTAAIAREPMPRNVADFKDHPIYALERHLRRNEVLVLDATQAGTISAGNKGPLEKIYRRRDVKIARTREKWYRLGRIVKDFEIPPKWLPKRTKPRQFDDEEEEEERGATGENGIPIYTIEQTELYKPPPVTNGQVPKNKFGNIDLYVPSMVPEGGEHITDGRAAEAAFLLRVDYAPALSGFSFQGRKGTAVMRGIVVPVEAAEAVRAVAEGLRDLEAEVEEEMRTRKVLTAWKRFLVGLRIRDRVGARMDEAPEEDEESVPEKEEDVEMHSPDEEGEEYDDYGGGGFFAE